MHCFYRISDNSYPKQKIPGATKEVCYKNFSNVFNGAQQTIIADRCIETLKFLPDCLKTDLGNAGSFHKALDLATECRDEEVIYFCEDDYLHQPNAAQVLREGMLHADYVTLYDHPDKYTSLYDMGEISKVVRTASSHWRYTVSTCMTFGSKVSILKEDMDIFKKWTGTVDKIGEHPLDHDIFCELKDRGRKLAVCIPGVACHTDLTFSGLVKNLMIEPWAVEMMLTELNTQLEETGKRIVSEEQEQFFDLKKAIERQNTGFNRLIRFDALLKGCLKG